MSNLHISPSDFISPRLLGIELKKNKDGHWIALRDNEVILGPYFNQPAFSKISSKGETVTVGIQNPHSNNQGIYIL